MLGNIHVKWRYRRWWRNKTCPDIGTARGTLRTCMKLHPWRPHTWRVVGRCGIFKFRVDIMFSAPLNTYLQHSSPARYTGCSVETEQPSGSVEDSDESDGLQRKQEEMQTRCAQNALLCRSIEQEPELDSEDSSSMARVQRAYEELQALYIAYDELPKPASGGEQPSGGSMGAEGGDEVHVHEQPELQEEEHDRHGSEDEQSEGSDPSLNAGSVDDAYDGEFQRMHQELDTRCDRYDALLASAIFNCQTDASTPIAA